MSSGPLKVRIKEGDRRSPKLAHEDLHNAFIGKGKEMASKERIKEILKGLRDAVVMYDKDKASEWAKIALDEGVDPVTAIINGLAHGMSEVGELYKKNEYFLPELVVCADALYEALNILRPHVKGKEASMKGQIVIGTVEGDNHDIGKNLVKMMLEGSGWVVHDLGADVEAEKFVEEQMRTNADIVALSAMTTATMMAMPKVIKMVKAQNPNVACMVGGAIMNRHVADLYGAEGFAENASGVDAEATRILREAQAKKPAN